MSKVLLLQGNQAVVEGAIAAGVKFFAGYPITPSTEVAESLAEKLPKNGGNLFRWRRNCFHGALLSVRP